MGVEWGHIITDFESDDDRKYVEEFKSTFRFIQAKEFKNPFHGIIGRIDEATLYQLDKSLDQREFMEEFEAQVVTFSEKHSHKSFAFLYVMCHAGLCYYRGFLAKGGNIIYEQPESETAHIALLGKLNSAFKEYYFEGFTRDFFEKKGEITGIMEDFSLAGLWLALSTSYPDKEKYRIDGGQFELIFIPRHRRFIFEFKKSKQNINIFGTLYKDDPETIEEIIAVIDECFVGMDFNLAIQLLDKEEILHKSSTPIKNISPELTPPPIQEVPKASIWERLKKFWNQNSAKDIN
ncbi:MAG: hypothetical protein ACK4WD_06470 [Flavobacteriales bacterium]|jgi:hypothetical protein